MWGGERTGQRRSAAPLLRRRRPPGGWPLGPLGLGRLETMGMEALGEGPGASSGDAW